MLELGWLWNKMTLKASSNLDDSVILYVLKIENCFVFF